MWEVICEFFKMFFIAVGIVLSQALTHILVKEICEQRGKEFRSDSVFLIWAVIFALIWTIA